MKILFSINIILVLLLFRPIHTISQSVQTLKDSIDKYNFYEPAKAIPHIEKIIKLYETKIDKTDYLLNLYFLLTNYYYLNDLEKVEENLTKWQAKAKNNLPKNHYLYSDIWYMYASVYDEKNNFDKSIASYQKSIQLYKLQNEVIFENLAIRYMNLGYVYERTGDYEQAILFYQKALSELSKSKELSYKNLPHILNNNIGFSYYKLRKTVLAQKYYDLALNQLQFFSPNEYPYNEDYHIIYKNIARLKHLQGNYKKALIFFQKKLDIPNPTEKLKATTYKHIGTTLLQLKKYNLALDTLNVALKIRAANYPKKHDYMSLIHQAIGDVYQAKQEYSKALDNYQSAIIAVVYDFENTDINKNPTLDNIVHQVELLKSLSSKAKTLQLMKKHQASLEVYELCSQLMDKMRSSFKHSGSKLFFMEQGNTIYEEAIVTALALGDKNAAFTFAEKSKAMLLLEAMRGITARFGLPEEVVKKESTLKIDIAYYERKIWEERQRDEPNTENIKKWESLIFDLKEEYTALKEQLETDYPEYYTLQYNSDVVSVREVQRKLLNSKSAMVSYFIGEEKVYIFTITKKGIEVSSIDKTDNLTDWVNNMRLCLQRDSRIQNYHATYYETAFQLYKIFLQPALQNLPKGIEQLIIIPDDQLNFIPFETLLTANPNLSSPRYELSKVPYLIRDYQVTYGYSGTLLLEGLKRREKNGLKIFGGFVPYFKGGTSDRRGCDNDVLGNLAIGRENIQTINTIMDGQLHFDEEADVDDFKDLAQDYQILHLCTHACAEMDFKDTRIYFSDKELLAFELYNMPLNAQLAVLSACETGVGELKRGEGVMSLARAFMHSGCPSVVTSLWSVDDKSTSEIMRYFYENLKAGMTKDAALHQAKLAYLDGKGIEESHPYFWSGFVHIGNTEALFGNEDANWIWWIGGGLMIGLFGFLFFRRKE